MADQGVIVNVTTTILGAYLAQDAALAAVSVVVDLIVDFNEAGGSLTLNGVTYAYTDADFETGTITLATGLTAGAVTGARVDVSPAVVEKTAEVMVDHAADSLTVRVPHTLMDRVPDGVRTGDGERVQFDIVDDRFVLTDVLGRQPVIDGSFLDPATVPPASTDGLPPASSPTPVVLGGIRQHALTWSVVANADLVTYDVEVALVSGGPYVFLGSTEGTFFISQIENPDYTATYYYRITARDADGSATPGAEVGSVLVPINSPDLAANIIRANNILAGEIQGFHFAANLLESGVIQTSAAGRRVVLDGNGFRLIDSNESLVLDFSTLAGAISTFYGALQTTSLISLDNFEMRGINNEQSVGSVYTLSAGVGQSGTPPVATVSYPTSPSNLDATFYRTKGVDWGATYSYYVRRFLDSTVLERRTISGQDGPSQDLFALGMFGWGVAICNDGTADRAMVLFEGKTAGGSPNGVWKVRKFNVTSWPTLSTVVDYTWTHDTAVIYFGAAIGRDFTDASRYITAEVLPGGTQIRFRRYSSVDGSLVSTTTTGDLTSIGLPGLADKTIRGVSRGTYDIGTDYYMVAMFDRVWFFDPGTGAFITSPGIGPSFFTNGTQNAFQWNPVASRFIGHNNDDTSATLYSGYGVTGNHSDTLWAAYTWYDSAGTTHETPMSAQKKFTMVKRGQVTLTAPSLPGAGGADDPNAVRFYLGGPSATALARTSMWDQATEPGTGVLTLTYLTLRLATGGGAVNPPSTNNFPAAAPALWQSGALAPDAQPQSKVYGDGTGRLRQVSHGQWYVHTSATDLATNTAGTFTDVTGFSFEAQAGAVYAIRCVLMVQNLGSSTPDIKFGWSWTGTGTMTFGQAGNDVNIAGAAYNGSWTAHRMAASSTSPLNETTGLGLTAGVPLMAFVEATYECATSGTVQLRFSQVTADATWVSRVQRGSRMKAERIV